MDRLSFLKKLYFKIGIHSAPRGTLFYFLHKSLFRAYVGLAVITGYQKRLLLRRRDMETSPSVTTWHPLQRDAKKVRRILLLKLDHIGDFVIAIPAFQLIRETFPNAEITLLCGRWNKDLAERSGFFDRIVYVNVFTEVSGESAGLSLSRNVLAVLSALPDFDIAIDLKVEANTREVLRHIRANYKAGYKSETGPDDMALSLMLPPTSAWDKPQQEHHTHHLLYMLASGVVVDFHACPDVKKSLSTIANSVADPISLRGAEGPVIGINTGSGTATKKWPLERFAALAGRIIHEMGATVVLFGSQHETKDAAQLIALVKSDRLVDCTGQRTLPEFVADLKQLDLFIGNDTGTTHLAAGMDVPTICLFSGVSDLGRFAPAGIRTSIIYRAVACAPCSLRRLQDCPREHLCMTSITVDDVIAEAARVLAMGSLHPPSGEEKHPAIAIERRAAAS